MLVNLRSAKLIGILDLNLQKFIDWQHILELSLAKLTLCPLFVLMGQSPIQSLLLSGSHLITRVKLNFEKNDEQAASGFIIRNEMKLKLLHRCYSS